MIQLKFDKALGPDEVQAIRTSVQAECKTRNIAAKNSFIILFVVDELSCNIMEHSRAGWMELNIDADPGGFKAVMKDDGVPFDTSSEIGEAKLKKVGGGESDRKIGLSLIGRLVDEVVYSREQGVNQVVISKRWNS